MPALEHAQPAVHGKQAAATVARVASLNVPSLQSVGFVDPARQYAPDGQGWQSSPLVSISAFEYVPAAQGCACADPVDPGQKCPRGQFSGLPLPRVQYLPPGHGRHASPSTEPVSGLYVPAAQRCSLTCRVPGGQYRPSRQSFIVRGVAPLLQ